MYDGDHSFHDVGDIEAGEEGWTEMTGQQDQRITERLGLRHRLYQAALKGDWETASSIEAGHEGALTKTINDRQETVLHIATRALKVAFIKKLVGCLNTKDLTLKNRYGNTALCIAATSGAVDIAKIMVGKNRNLTRIRGSGNATPLLIAASCGHKHMVSYLLRRTPFNCLQSDEQMELLVHVISADYYDIALFILDKEHSLALRRDINEDTALHIMARKSRVIGRKDHKSTMWKCIIKSFKCINRKTMMQIQARQLVIQMWKIIVSRKMSKDHNLLDFINHPSSMLHDAVRVGNVEFLRLIIDSYPDLAWNINEKKKSIFHVAVETRQANVFGLIYEKGEFLDDLPSYFDEETMSLLELAAKMPDPSHLNRVTGPAFQMLHELLWFKEVEKIENLTMRRKKEARELFTKEHKELAENGIKWMEKTANFCMVVATVIATVVFAAGFTLPGGVNGNTGAPLFLHRKCFTFFVISDAIALISSSTSILMFLSILMSHSVEDDFHFWLPLKLVLGLGTLFFSALTMMMAFSASLFLLYRKDAIWVPLMIVGIGSVPVFCLFMVQFKLWGDIIAALQATWRSYFLLRNRRMKVLWISNIIALWQKFYKKESKKRDVLYKTKQRLWGSQSATVDVQASKGQ